MVFDSDTDEDDFAPANANVPGGYADNGEDEGVNVYAAYNAFYDEEMEPESDAPGARFAPNDHEEDDNHNDAAEHEETKKKTKEKKKKKPARSSPGRASKRRRRVESRDGGGDGDDDDDDDDDDFESQQSILKWVRTVPGPLQDVIKNQQAMEAENSGQFASGGSMLSGAMISTVFDDGPWVDMCAFLGIPTTPGKLYGGVRMSSLKHTLSYILEDDQSSPKIPKLLLLVKSMKYVDEEIVAVFHDPTGEIEGYFHRDIVEQVGPALGAGTGVLLRKVSVFIPTDATSVGRRKSYLNIIPRNLQRVFLPPSQVSSYGATVDVYNKERAVLVAAEDADDENHRAQEEEEQRLLQHDALRHASTELSFLSQRQVVHRNPPVRLDPNAAAAKDGKGKGKKSKKKDESSSGLGKWQWNQLVQRKSTNATSRASSASSARPVHANDREDGSSNNQMLPTSRFTALLSRQIATKRRSSETGMPGSSLVGIEGDDDDDDDVEEESAEDNRTMPTRVRFAAAPVVVEIPAASGASSADVSENEEVFLNKEDSTPQPAVLRQSPAKKKAPVMPLAKRRDEEVEAVDDEDDDDDDW